MCCAALQEFLAPRREVTRLSFRPKGEILLRSLAFARDDGPRPVTWRAWRLCASDVFFRFLNVFHFIDTGYFDLLEAPVIFHRCGGVDSQAGGDSRLRTRRVQRRAGETGNDDGVLVGLEARGHRPVHLHWIERIDVVVDQCRWTGRWPRASRPT